MEASRPARAQTSAILRPINPGQDPTRQMYAESDCPAEAARTDLVDAMRVVENEFVYGNAMPRMKLA
jgi:hypothetical protein